MRRELEQIVAVDEEARSRVAFAEEQSARAIGAANDAADLAITAKRRAAAAQLESEVDAIRSEGAAQIAEIHARDEDYLARAREAGERQLETAARLYARIILHGPEEQR